MTGWLMRRIYLTHASYICALQPDPAVCNVTDNCTGFLLDSDTYNSTCRV